MASIMFSSQMLRQGTNPMNSYPLTLKSIAGLSNVCSDLYEYSTSSAHCSNMISAFVNGWYANSLLGLFVYKGTPMTQGELDSVSYQTDLTKSPRYSDLLLQAPCTFVPSGQNSYSATPTFVPKLSAAVQSGAATWALIGEMASNPFLCLLSITATGGGGDLEVPDTSITAGSKYLFGKITLTPKLSFTW